MGTLGQTNIAYQELVVSDDLSDDLAPPLVIFYVSANFHLEPVLYTRLGQ